MPYLLAFIGGLAVGAGLVMFISFLQRGALEKTFRVLSVQALQESTDQFLKLAKSTLAEQTKEGELELEGKKKLIDQHLENIRGDLVKVETLVTGLEKDRAGKFGELSAQLKQVAEQTGKLQTTTGRLETALASTRARGQWGERMAEDILRFIGFIEGVNYLKQKAQETVTTRPDYTFLLPRNLKVNMDVKFPLDNYLKYCSAADTEKLAFQAQFLNDVKQRINEVTTRDYINPAENTVDYVLVFIPNEQVYCFIQESDGGILDMALQKRVILCSPLTLYAVLAVMRQAVENFNVEQSTQQIKSLMDDFTKQWENFKKSMDKVGERIDQAHREYESLVSTRTNQLEKPLQKIAALRQQREIAAELEEGEPAAPAVPYDGGKTGQS